MELPAGHALARVPQTPVDIRRRGPREEILPADGHVVACVEIPDGKLPNGLGQKGGILGRRAGRVRFGVEHGGAAVGLASRCEVLRGDQSGKWEMGGFLLTPLGGGCAGGTLAVGSRWGFMAAWRFGRGSGKVTLGVGDVDSIQTLVEGV